METGETEISSLLPTALSVVKFHDIDYICAKLAWTQFNSFERRQKGLPVRYFNESRPNDWHVTKETKQNEASGLVEVKIVMLCIRPLEYRWRIAG